VVEPVEEKIQRLRISRSGKHGPSSTATDAFIAHLLGHLRKGHEDCACAFWARMCASPIALTFFSSERGNARREGLRAGEHHPACTTTATIQIGDTSPKART